MDKHENSSRPMIKINFGEISNFFSGRSRVLEILDKYSCDDWHINRIEVSFINVDSCSQSFISELIYQLKEKGVKKGFLTYKLEDNSTIKRKIDNELIRFQMV